MTTRRNPFDELERLFDRMGEQFESEWRPGFGSMGGLGVPVDVADEGDAFVVTADLPGYAKEEIDLQLRDDTLLVSAEHETSEATEAERDTVQYIRRERRAEAAKRTVTLPEDVLEDEVSASYANGVLTVTLPKAGGGDGDGHRIEVE